MLCHFAKFEDALRTDYSSAKVFMASRCALPDSIRISTTSYNAMNMAKFSFKLDWSAQDRHQFNESSFDSKNEREFVSLLDCGTEIEVYDKLPKSLSIPTPLGAAPWAIAFKQGAVKHVHFIAETKGSLSSMELREIEKSKFKIECARKFFARIKSDQVKYDVVDSKLTELVQS
jgi:restriction endonuclease